MKHRRSPATDSTDLPEYTQEISAFYRDAVGRSMTEALKAVRVITGEDK